jgi:membrane protein required for colicin V production
VQEAISLAAWAAALIAVRTLHTPLSDAGAACGHQQRGHVLAFLAAAGALSAGADAGADDWFGQQASVLGPVDRVLGFGFGAVKGHADRGGGLTVLVLAMTRSGAGWPPHLDHKSRTYPFINASSDALVQALAERRRQAREAAKAEDADSSEADAKPAPRHASARRIEGMASVTAPIRPRCWRWRPVLPRCGWMRADAARAGALASCGSTLEVGLALDGEGRIARIGLAAQACGGGAGGLRDHGGRRPAGMRRILPHRRRAGGLAGGRGADARLAGAGHHRPRAILPRAWRHAAGLARGAGCLCRSAGLNALRRRISALCARRFANFAARFSNMLHRTGDEW